MPVVRAALGEGVLRHGKISVKPARVGFSARCSVRVSEKVYSVTAQGPSTDTAIEALITKLGTWTPPAPREVKVKGPDGEPIGPEGQPSIKRVNAKDSLGEVIKLWVHGVSQNEELQIQTREYWRRVARQTILKEGVTLAALPVGKVTARDVQNYLDALRKKTPGQARKARSMLKIVFRMAIRDDSTIHNPMHDVGAVKPTKEQKKKKKKVRALSHAEFLDFRSHVAEWRAAGKQGQYSRRDPSFLVTDVIECLAGTGLRINELLGLRPQDLDLDAEKPSLTVCGTLVDVTGSGVSFQEEPKTEAGERRLALPPTAVAAFRRQLELNGSSEWVFTTGSGLPIRDSNITRVIRQARPAHLDFVTPHTFRRSVATWLKATHETANATAQLGHASEAVTEEFYIEQRTTGLVDNSDTLEAFLN